MTEDELIAAAEALPGAVVEVADEASGAPEVAWGDVFVFHDPDGTTPAERRWPFATIVHRDSDGAISIDGRDDVFRVNFGVGRERFTELIGRSPSSVRDALGAFDFTALDQLLPHPVYHAQAWVSILNPGESTSAMAADLLAEAHAREARRTG